ncbi:hypothetical protein [Oleiharenicola lentus]|uniref:hypothetical protein n=1 Tax=Oleiharenicola lentus TaxID=2508720 RepID=UPI003F677576
MPLLEIDPQKLLAQQAKLIDDYEAFFRAHEFLLTRISKETAAFLGAEVDDTGVASYIAKLRGGLLAHQTNFILRRECFVGLDRNDLRGVQKIAEQLPNQTSEVLKIFAQQVFEVQCSLEKQKQEMTAADLEKRD